MYKTRGRLLFVLVLGTLACPIARARPLQLAAYDFDTDSGSPLLPADLTASSGDYAEYGYFLVQTDQPVTAGWRERLEAGGAVIYGYVGEFAFLVGCDAAAQRNVRAAAGTVWMAPFHPAYKISPDIGLHPLVSPERLRDPNLTLLVRVFRDLDGAAARITALGARVLDRTDDGFSRRLVVSAPKGMVADIARLRDVWWIEEKPEFRFLNNTTKWVVQSNNSGQTPIWDHGIHGEGQIATVMDTGVDYNSCWFRDTGDAPPGPSHRKIIDYSTWGSGVPYDGCDIGHGSHVAGTLAGDQSFINPGNINYNGMAYEAKLTVQDIGPDDWSACNLGTAGVPNSLTAAFDSSYNLGARVHSDSWGSGNNAYDSYCVDVDNAMWNHPDYLVCFAAGNSGSGAGTVGSPATAKDLITVGATRQAPDQENVADYSSRGPTSDGRTKPTLTAPGGQDPIFITSVDNDPNDPPRETCQTQSSPFQGTSMAAPAVAGCALDVRQYYVDGFYPGGVAGGSPLLPSAALIKATLIAATDDMGAADIPNNDEGWGRIQLDNALYFDGDTRKLLVHDDRNGLDTGGAWFTDFAANSDSEPLVVTLVWTDYPATAGSGAPLVNDLDLVVAAPDGSHYKGNVFSGGFSVTGGDADRKNVEEAVRIQHPLPGRWDLDVLGHNVPQGPQPFALVINGALAEVSAVDHPAAPAQPFLAVYPNPVSSNASLHYAVPAGYAGPVALEIVDVQGRLVRTLVGKGQVAGDYRVSWQGQDDLGRPVPNGIYFARLAAGAWSAKTKIVVRR